MDNHDKSCILFFVKYPEKGKVKTRLAVELNETVAFELYKNFVLDLLSMLEKVGTQFLICHYPANSQEEFVKWLRGKYSYMPQQGDDLGQRMKNSFTQIFGQGYERAILIGSDSPDLPGDLVIRALSALNKYDTVIGPSFDGGYYLIGFKSSSFLPAAFEGIEWSTDTVFRETIHILEKANLEICRLQKRIDVDEFADLRTLFQGSQNKDFLHSRTMSYIYKNRLLCD